jgi:rRNA maturation RNase YbeY
LSKEGTIHFHSEGLDFELESPHVYIDWIRQIIEKENRICGDINYIFCSDAHLHSINLQYLNHDDLTDIITFNYNEKDTISSDIFISIERVKENAADLNLAFDKELKRVMAHGILHLLGYDDKTAEDQAAMRSKEDFYLTLHPLK